MLHTDAAKAAYAEFGLEVLPAWPTFSPDLNPQENVWSWAEAALRKEEQPGDSFVKFLRKLLVVVRRYPNAEALVPSMHARIEEVLRCKGAMTKYWATHARAAENRHKSMRFQKMDFFNVRG